MNESTDVKKYSIISSWQFKFFTTSILILVAVLGKVIISSPNIPYKYSKPFNGMMESLDELYEYIPPYSAGKITSENGIAEFTGKPIPHIGMMTYTRTFIAFFLFFVAAPATYVLLRQKRISNINQQRPTSSLVRWLIIMTAAWCLLFTGFTIATFYATNSAFSRVKHDNDISQYRDDVVKTLMDISFKLREYFILPAEMGGGGNSYLKEHRLVTLREIGFDEKSPMGHFHLYRTDSDTTVQIHFVGNKMLPKQSWDNQNIDHVVEYEITVNPTSNLITKRQ